MSRKMQNLVLDEVKIFEAYPLWSVRKFLRYIKQIMRFYV